MKHYDASSAERVAEPRLAEHLTDAELAAELLRRAQAGASPTLRVAQFLRANARSAVVYFNGEGQGVTYRLADGSVWQLSRHEARKLGHPRWAHLPELRPVLAAVS
jgi:hypothetical protein